MLSSGLPLHLAIPLLMSDDDYASRVLKTSPLAYWKLDEGSGTTITDSSGNGYNGTSTGWTWDGTKFVKGGDVPLSDGANDYGDVYSAGLAAAFDADEGCMLIWAKVSNASVWTDGVNRHIMRIRGSATSDIIINKPAAANTISFSRIDTVGSKTISGSISTTEWFSALLSWSVTNDQLLAYINGVSVGSQTGLNTIVDPPVSASTLLGAAGKTFGVFDGYMAYALVYDRSVDSDILEIAS